MEQILKESNQKTAIEIIQQLIHNYGATSLSHLGLLGDKKVFISKDQKSAFVYREQGNKLVVLCDPIGECSFEKIIEFENFSMSINCTPCFYQIDDKSKLLYEKAGYRLFKLGEEAIVELERFEITGKKGAKLRTKRNKFIRQGYQFEVKMPSHSLDLLNELKKVSDEWLDGRDELSFSVGSFHFDYVSNFPVGLLRNKNGQIIAFATLPVQGENMTIDLMRYLKELPYGAMDMLFVSIMFWAKENGFKNCSLGMAPLANVGLYSNATLIEKSAKMIFKYGNSIYNFKGLLTFKSKFANKWESKYLAYKPYTLLSVITSLYCLVHGIKSFNYITRFRKPLKKNIKIG
ncbi:phosphatidylglycerol lysyltransferase domain-containing protein [Gottfriedia luciferensis]|uniref:phosphatidylglycerol lysyltransferase domain-containing protein n=1 Tax=Gottfriedia luciferensis TaxID=178774 RepID=UPI000B43375D|nr:phosphatidylglycerol lysyltransferase domain-containing protein [Gottfriedia luciferensis]